MTSFQELALLGRQVSLRLVAQRLQEVDHLLRPLEIDFDLAAQGMARCPQVRGRLPRQVDHEILEMRRHDRIVGRGGAPTGRRLLRPGREGRKRGDGGVVGSVIGLPALAFRREIAPIDDAHRLASLLVLRLGHGMKPPERRSRKRGGW